MRNVLDGVLETKISNILGFLRREEGHYVGPGGTKIL